jgi:hypothetical protein
MSIAGKRKLRAPLDLNTLEHVYVFDDPSYKIQPCFKVGCSTRMPEARLTELNRGRSTKLGFVYASVCHHAHPVEQIVHKLLDEFRVPGTEFFAGVHEHVVVNLVRSVCDLNMSIHRRTSDEEDVAAGASSAVLPMATPLAFAEAAPPVVVPSEPVPAAATAPAATPPVENSQAESAAAAVESDDADDQNSADIKAVRDATFYHAIFASGTTYEAVRSVFTNATKKMQRRNAQCAIFLEAADGKIMCLFSEGSEAGAKVKQLRSDFPATTLVPVATYTTLLRELKGLLKPSYGPGAKVLGHFRCPEALMDKCK